MPTELLLVEADTGDAAGRVDTTTRPVTWTYTGSDPDGDIEAFLTGIEDGELYHDPEAFPDGAPLYDDDELAVYIAGWLRARPEIQTVFY